MKVSSIGLAGLAISAILMGLTLKFSATEVGGPRRPARSTSSPKGPWVLERSASSRNTRYIMKDANGRMTWDLYARSIKYEKERERVEGTDVRCVLLGEEQAPVAVLVARGAVLNPETMDVAFHGEVRVRSARGEIITVPHLWYSGRKKKLFGRGGVRITRGDTVLTGDAMVGYPDMRVFTLRGRVRAVGDKKALEETFTSESPAAGLLYPVPAGARDGLTASPSPTP